MKVLNLSYYISGLLIFISLQTQSTNTLNNRLYSLKFRQFSTLDGLPNNEVQTAFQDTNGFIWIGTKFGLFRYDGYGVREIKSNLHTPQLLTSNNIQCLAEDTDRRLWIGTNMGFNILDQRYGHIQKIIIPRAVNNNINSILILDSCKALIGTENGLYLYYYHLNYFTLFDKKNTQGIFPSTTVKTLIKDSNGDVLIGTWNRGLYRYIPSSGLFYHYQPLNQQNSVHCLYEDSQGTLWAGGWSSGLYRLHFSKDRRQMTFDSYRHIPFNNKSLSHDLVYSISEEETTHTLWVGTSSGLSITDIRSPGNFTNYQTHHSPHNLPSGEIDALLQDKGNGEMWLGSLGGGIIHTNIRKPLFEANDTIASDVNILTTSVYSIYIEENTYWIGAENHGIMRYSPEDYSHKEYSEMPEFSNISSMSTIIDITRSTRTNELFLASFSDGLYIYKQGKPVRNYTSNNCKFLPDNHLSALFEDENGNIWIGTQKGLGVICPDGYATTLSSLETGVAPIDNFDISYITTDDLGNLWLATSNDGIIRLKADPKNLRKNKVKRYNLKNKKLSANQAFCLYFDSQKQLWAGTEGSGLCLYNPDTDSFDDKQLLYNLPGDMVCSIEEDKSGNLWLGTNCGLARIVSAGDDEHTSTRVFTTGDGLQDNYFNPHCSFQLNNKLFFGSNKGFISFVPTELNHTKRTVNFYITEISVGGHKLSQLKADEREKISALNPEFTKKVVIPYKYNDLRIEFSSLTYNNPQLNKYAYKLEGVDEEWKYTDGTHRLAEYNNLSGGTYTFLVKATNENGDWSHIRQLEVKVLSPPWATWWAYLLYTAFAGLFIYYIWQDFRHNIALKNSLRMHVMETYNKNEKQKRVLVNIDSYKVQNYDETFLNQAIECVKAHLKDPDFSVPQFVESMGNSKTTLYNKLKDLTGMNISGFIQNIRLKAACQIMQEQPNIRISDLAYTVGFSDPKYFSRCFKNSYGMQPKEYMKRYQPKVENKSKKIEK
jgi:ligand-binding sensor domain-containing protein/AraC-like DNA-binding protein